MGTASLQMGLCHAMWSPVQLQFTVILPLQPLILCCRGVGSMLQRGFVERLPVLLSLPCFNLLRC